MLGSSIRWLGSCFTLFLFALLGLACTREPITKTQSYVFGTLVDISIYGVSEQEAQTASKEVLNAFQSLHHQLHAWSPDSELSKVNQAIRLGKPVEITPSLAAMLLDAKALSLQSKEVFNPAIGQLIATWGFHRDQFQPIKVNPETLAVLVNQHPSMEDITISQHDGRWQLLSQNPSVQLDLGGYAKGYALDQAKHILQEHHIQHALVNIGGNILAIGQHGERPWRVGIQHPRQPSALASVDLPDGWSIGTSGDYQRYFIRDGQRYCHIIDPSTGWPVLHTQAVTVLIPPSQRAGVLSDVVSKPIFIKPLNEKSQAAEQMLVSDYLIFDAKGDLYVSATMKKKLKWTTAIPTLHNLSP